MHRNATKREGLSKFQRVIMPSMVKLIEKNEKSCHGVSVIPVDVSEFEVDNEESCVVYLTNKACDCGRWTLIGIPCKYAIETL